MPEYRKHGIGRALFEKLKATAHSVGVHWMYLHTHDFLTGAEQFWKKQGFEVAARTLESRFDTIHMDLRIQ